MKRVDFGEKFLKQEFKEIEKIREDITKELWLNSLVRNKLKQLGFSREDLRNNLSPFISFSKNMASCDNCSSLENCNQKVQGHLLDLILSEDNYLIEKYYPCQYLIDFINFEKNLILYEMPVFWKKINIEKILGSDSNAQISRQLVKLLATIEKGSGGYLYGRTGTGKSYYSTALINYFAQNYNYKIAIISTSNLLATIKSLFTDKRGYNEYINDLRTVDVLCLDDLGAESISKWSRDEVLYPLIDYRINNGKITLFNSLYHLKELESVYSKCDKEYLRSEKLATKIKNYVKKETILD